MGGGLRGAWDGLEIRVAVGVGWPQGWGGQLLRRGGQGSIRNGWGGAGDDLGHPYRHPCHT